MSTPGKQHGGIRKNGHNYRAPWKYHVTLTKANGCESFSELKVNDFSSKGIKLNYTSVGMTIWNGLRALQQLGPIRVYQYCIMPDHIHLLLHVTQPLPRHLGFYLAAFKSHVTSRYRISINDESAQVFNGNYYDRIILPEHNLNDIYQYIRQNPYRLAIRQLRPDFFEKRRNIFIVKREIQAYGNLFLLRNPFKYQLVIHRNDTDMEFCDKLEACLYHANNGGVVVSPFISPREKSIRKEIEDAGGRIILVKDRPFGDREKPARHDFDLCSQGRLLIISAIDYLSLQRAQHPSRAQCLDMNSLANTLASLPPGEIRVNH